MISVGIRVKDAMGQPVKDAQIFLSHQPFCSKVINVKGVADMTGTIMFAIPEDSDDEKTLERKDDKEKQ